MPTFAPLRSRRALVATVVPCTISPVSASSPARSVPSSAAGRTRPSMTRMAGSPGREPHVGRPRRPARARVGTVTRGVGRERVPLEERREARLRDLDAAELYAGRGLALARGLPAVARGGRAAAGARVEEVQDELARVPRVRARDRD